MPEISPEKVCLIAIHAREFQVKVAPEDLDQGSNASDDGMRVILEDYKDDSTYEQLVRALDSLRPDELSEVMAIAYSGFRSAQCSGPRSPVYPQWASSGSGGRSLRAWTSARDM